MKAATLWAAVALGASLVAAPGSTNGTATVVISLAHFRGVPNNHPVTIHMRDQPEGLGTNLVFGPDIIGRPTNGVARVELYPGNYALLLDGIDRPLLFSIWTNGGTWDISQIITNGLSAALSDPPQVMQLIAGSGIGLSPTNGKGRVRVSVEGAATLDTLSVTNGDFNAMTVGNGGIRSRGIALEYVKSWAGSPAMSLVSNDTEERLLYDLNANLSIDFDARNLIGPSATALNWNDSGVAIGSGITLNLDGSGTAAGGVINWNVNGDLTVGSGTWHADGSASMAGGVLGWDTGGNVTSLGSLLDLTSSIDADTANRVYNSSASFHAACAFKMKTGYKEFHFGLGGHARGDFLTDSFYVIDQGAGQARLLINSTGDAALGGSITAASFAGASFIAYANGVAAAPDKLAGTNYVYANHFSGLTNMATPTIVTNAGAGSATGTVTLDAEKNNVAMTVTLLTGTSPTSAATVCTCTYGAAYSRIPHVVLTPANAAAAALTGATQVHAPRGSASAYTIVAGSSALAAATTYVWTAHIIQ